MSALPPKADMVRLDRDVRFGQKQKFCAAAKLQLFDHLVGAGLKHCGNIEADRFGCL